MRFFEKGPDIPDDLLNALEDDRVVFFCGAGVSQAKAKLPDFTQLTTQVIDALDASDKLKSQLKEGTLKLDAVFSQLKREFTDGLVDTEVTKLLRPIEGYDPSAHKIILDLATTQAGNTKLVTTNFDRIFEECKELQNYSPKDLSALEDFNGLVYLHGKVNQGYDAVERDGLILSEEDFSEAYLTYGSSTIFLKDLVEKYTVLFVGYAANDPLIHYLLKGLNYVNKKSPIFAFRPENDNLWDGIRSVRSIPYETGNGESHEELWNTLEAWSRRVQNIEKWQADIVEMAKESPDTLLPYKRGQVAHLVSSKSGMRKFCSPENPPHPNWLKVFDSAFRYENHTSYKIDNDFPPLTRANSFERVQIPYGAWDAFHLTDLDFLEYDRSSVLDVKGQYSLQQDNIPKRLKYLGEWISKVSDRDETVQWAARQNRLHPYIQWLIEISLQKDSKRYIKEAWYYLFEYWKNIKNSKERDWFYFRQQIKNCGWNSTAIRYFELLTKPKILATPRYSLSYDQGSELPVADNWRNIINLEIQYYENNWVKDLVIPDDSVHDIVAVLGTNIKAGIKLEDEILDYKQPLPPITSPPTEYGRAYLREEGIIAMILLYTELLERLIKINPKEAYREVSNWPEDDNDRFIRLRTWASCYETLVPANEFEKWLINIKENLIWEDENQRDLHRAITTRWDNLSKKSRLSLEQFILRGICKRKGENESTYKYRVIICANILFTLHNNQSFLKLNYKNEMTRLKAIIPDWKPKLIEEMDEWIEPFITGGHIETDESYTELENIPISEVIKRAQILSSNRREPLKSRLPFKGLCKFEPNRAYESLINVSTDIKCHNEWIIFLDILFDPQETIMNKENKNKLQLNCIQYLAEMSKDDYYRILSIKYPFWILNLFKKISTNDLHLFDKLFTKGIDYLKNTALNPAYQNTTGNNKDWVTLAINSHSGIFTEALFSDARFINSLKHNISPPGEWFKLFESLLSLSGDNKRYVLCRSARWIGYLYESNIEWTKNFINRFIITDDKENSISWWSGYLIFSNRLLHPQLFHKVKHTLLRDMNILAKATGISSTSNKVIFFILESWAHDIQSKNKIYFNNSELKNVLKYQDNSFRTHVLLCITYLTRIREDWINHSLIFFQIIWPKEAKYRSSDDTEYLVKIIFNAKDKFKDAVGLILPLLTKLKPYGLDTLFYSNSEEGWKIEKKYPALVVDILNTILTDNVTHWPYNIGALFDIIVQTDPTLVQNQKYIKLIRLWNAR